MNRLARAALAGAAAAALAVPGSAAAVVTVGLAGGTLTVTGSTDDDEVTFSSAGSNALGPTTRVSGGGQDMQAAAGCQGFGDPNGPANDQSVFCPTNDIQRLSADLLDGDDEITNGLGVDATLATGPGDDEITIGRTGSDGENTVDAGPGEDTIRAGRAEQADDLAGGPDRDVVSYASHGAVTVTLDGVPDDGAEGDNVRPDIEDVTGTSGDDTLVGNDGPNTLDGAGGTDRLEGLGGADTLIGGQGTGDLALGGTGPDAIMLRDGLKDACPNGGPDANTFDLDLVDPSFLNPLTRSQCFQLAPGTGLVGRVLIGAVDEGPNVRMSVPSPAVGGAGVRVRLACPAVLDKPCAGPLRVFTDRGRQALGAVSYSIRPGRASVVLVPLDDQARATARAAKALRIVSVERGRSRKGPKTTILVVP